MSDYTETVTKLRDVYRAYVVTGNEKAGQFLSDAAAAIEELQAEAGQWKAAVKGQEDGIKVLQAEVKRLQEKLCDWCAVCPKERRNPDDCELLGENPVMYGPSGTKMEAQDGTD